MHRVTQASPIQSPSQAAVKQWRENYEGLDEDRVAGVLTLLTVFAEACGCQELNLTDAELDSPADIMNSLVEAIPEVRRDGEKKVAWAIVTWNIR